MKTLKGFFITAAIFCLTGAAFAAQEIGKDGKAEKSADKIVFKDKAAKIKKEIRLENREFTESGKTIRQKMKALRSKDTKFTVVQDETRDVNEVDPYKIRFSSGTIITWYDEAGTEISQKLLGGRSYVEKISDNGNVIILIDEGFEDVEFEKYYVAGQSTTEPLKQDRRLKTTYLAVMNDKWETLFSTMSRRGGWRIAMVSPLGKWLALQERGNYSSKNLLTVVDIANKKVFYAEWGKGIKLKGITDEGKLLGRKFVKDGGGGRKVKFHGGAEGYVGSQIWEEYEWVPDMNDFKSTGVQKEED
ncbi:MAG: hypothetical protein WCK75_07525 [Elusimicrobiota bacterium]